MNGTVIHADQKRVVLVLVLVEVGLETCGASATGGIRGMGGRSIWVGADQADGGAYDRNTVGAECRWSIGR